MKMSKVWEKLAEAFQVHDDERGGICNKVDDIDVPFQLAERVRQTINKTRQSLYGLYEDQVSYLWKLDERGSQLRRLYCLNQAAEARKAEAKARKSKRR